MTNAKLAKINKAINAYRDAVAAAVRGQAADPDYKAWETVGVRRVDLLEACAEEETEAQG